MPKDKDFDGSYEKSRYAKNSLETDILRAGQGYITGETSTGGLFKISDTRIDVFSKGKPGNYEHHYYNQKTGEYGSR